METRNLKGLGRFAVPVAWRRCARSGVPVHSMERACCARGYLLQEDFCAYNFRSVDIFV